MNTSSMFSKDNITDLLGIIIDQEINDDSVFGENQLSQMSNMTDRTKLLFKKTMDEYPNVEEDTFFNSLQSKN